MGGLGVFRTMSNILARMTVSPGRGGHPTDRWQDKRREVRGGRVGEERRQISHLARGAFSHHSLSIYATPWKIETTRTSHAVASCAQSRLMRRETHGFA